MLQQLMTLWEGMEARRRLIVVGATVAMFLAVLGLAAMSASQPAMSLLYAGLNGKASGELLSALDQRGARYEIRGDAIYVPAAERDALRMALAGEGLPATGGAGYELLDNISGFGTTAQMFDAAYWRAKEGELARTIVASPMVHSARVHIAVPVNQPFRSEARPTASVAISGANGPVPLRQAQAVRHLVAAAVSGLRAEDVAVIDAETGVVIADEEAQPPGGEDRAAQLRQSVQRLLEAHVGVGRAIVEVAVDTVTEREAITEKTFDPAGRVPISSENEENSTSSNETRPAPVTVASNLPAGAASQGGTAQNNESRTRERVNYEVSQKTREVLRTPGATRRMTVAVLVDGVHSPDAGQTAVFQPRPEEELASLRELVASAVGFDEARGDVITIRSLPLQPPVDAGSLVEASWLAGLHVDAMQLAQILVLAIVALVLGLFVLRPALLGPAAARAEALSAPGDGPAALTGEIHEGEVPLGAMSLVSDGAGVDGLPDFGGGFAMGSFGGGDETPVDRLRRLIAERREETAEILRAWMEEGDEEKVG